MTRFMFRAVSAAFLLTTSFALALAQDDLKSGPQPGKSLPDTFHAFNINGMYAGTDEEGKEKERTKKGRYHSLIAEYGLQPVVMIFADEGKAGQDPALMQLLEKLDEAISEDQQIGDSALGAFVVFLSPEARSVVTETAVDKDKLTSDPADLVGQAAQREKYFKALENRAAPFKHVVVMAYPPPGPKEYNLSDKAAVTVILYHRLKVQENIAFAGQMDEENVTQIMAAVRTMMKRR